MTRVTSPMRPGWPPASRKCWLARALLLSRPSVCRQLKTV